MTLRLIARRTWRFFEQFVTAQDNMLPPDNFQEDPTPIVAHRTSPTNIGLYLLSVVAARDFGWSGTLETVERLEATFATMGKLERFRGHFYNWYDTVDLRALEPKYVSSVDSGNLAGHLLALGIACREIVTAPVGNPRWVSGLEDVVALIREALDPQAVDGPDAALVGAVDAFAAALQAAPANPAGIVRYLADLAAKADQLVDLAGTCEDKSGNRRDSDMDADAARDRRRTSPRVRSADAVGEPGGQLSFGRRRNCAARRHADARRAAGAL